MSPPSSLFESFELLARQGPGKLALHECAGTHRSSRRALLDQAQMAARSLRDRGLRPGDPVLVHASGRSLVVAMLAVWARDGVALLADPQLTGRELDAIEKAFEPRFRIIDADRGGPRVEARETPGGTPHPPLPDDTAVIKLTSGSTGRPRGIAMTASQLQADARHIAEGMGIAPDDVNVAAIPMSHSYGLSSLLLLLVTQGSPLSLVPLPLPDLLVEALSIERPAVFPGVPYLFDLLARPDAPAFKRRGLRLCVSAGAPLRARTAAAFRDRYGLSVRAFYGTSETGGLAYDGSPDGNAAMAAEGCVGTALPGVELSLMGEEGRVVARGTNVASGYIGPRGEVSDGEFRDPREFLTGDTGRLDAEGRLHLTGRLGARVNVSGRKVDPREVELALGDLDGVRDAVVGSTADDRRGESLVAYLVAEPRVTRATVLSHLRSNLASWKLPRDVVFLNALPRNARGKPDMRALSTAAAATRRRGADS
jgi:long-chain acyl-CoA synthetase